MDRGTAAEHRYHVSRGSYLAAPVIGIFFRFYLLSSVSGLHENCWSSVDIDFFLF